MDEKYTLYADGVKLAEGLTINGTNYVSKTEVDVSGLSKVFRLTVKNNDGNTTEEFEHAKLLQQVQYAWDDNKFYLAFAPVSEQEIKNNEFQSNLQYLAMMADLEL
ncbi:MAG: hypothetical protein J5965_00255 [Aeriscardovia sp.]|nr:hypothetical protein [Aeriscardovia sp.]